MSKKSKKKNTYADSMEFGDLEPGVYGVRINPFDLWHFYHGLPEHPMMVIELSGRPIIIEVSDESRPILQVAMGKPLEDITDEEGFTIHKDGRVTITRG